MPQARRNQTGFDVRKFIQSSGASIKDPWARAEQWRYTGPFTRWNRFRGSFPGLGIATVAFTAYCGYEYLFMKSEHPHGETDHDGEHH